jgi:glycosyltransferase domain-containing protein
MHDFTLLIPTCDSARLLAALLGYLETEKTDCQVLVLDSSRTDAMAVNRAQIKGSVLDIERVELPGSDPGEIVREGIRRVLTPFCAVCADEDLIVLEGVQDCLAVLRRSPGASVAHGYSFSFLPHPDGNMELNEMHFTSTIDDASPLGRLGNLCARYQTLTSEVFRTPVLRRICDTLQPITNALARNLLWSALAVIGGQSLFVPCFGYGRRARPLDPHSDPLQWFCKDPEGLFAEYLRYREILTAAVMRRPDNELQPEEVRDLLDLIHLRYLIQRAPDSMLAFIGEQQMAGVAHAERWPRHEIPPPLYEATGIEASTEPETLGPITLQGCGRSYILFPHFYAPERLDPPRLASVVRLIAALEKYRPPIDRDAAPELIK